jgi:hypothetical protein
MPIGVELDEGVLASGAAPSCSQAGTSAS